MKLTNNDKTYLLSIGYANDDLNEIENTTRKMSYELYSMSDDSFPDISITQKQAITLLGKESFLSGIARATFHSTAIQTIKGFNAAVYFERKK